MNKTSDKSKRYWNPYFGGFMLGIVLLATFYITGRGLGASGAAKSTVVAAINRVAPSHASESPYYSLFISDDEHPMNNWLVFEVLGVFAGALLSGAIAGRLKLKVEHAPAISSRTRLIMAGLGGLFFGIGSQLARGCTSGAALSGMASMATAGFLTTMAIFGSAYVFAYFFRKFWI
jgi:uncharacterized membrane protein YedE/YeeE